MDAGAKPAWEHNFDASELSAVEHAMRWYLFNRAGFLAECQQEPMEEHLSSGRMEVIDLVKKLNGRPRGQVPQACQWLTCQVDVHERLLYYHVSAFEPDFTGYRIDWGTEPEQPDRYFSMPTCRLPLADKYPRLGREGAIYAGLEKLLGRLLSASYPRDDGAALPIDLAGVDTGWEQDTVARVIRALGRGRQLTGTKGVGLTAASKPFPAYKPEVGAQIGHHWRVSMAPKIQLLVLNYDANRWKSFYRDRIRVAMGAPGSFSFFGVKAHDEQMYAEHHTVESPVATSGPFGEVEVWKMPTARPDQHLWDCAVGCCILASKLGAKLPEWGRAVQPPAQQKPAAVERRAVSYL